MKKYLVPLVLFCLLGSFAAQAQKSGPVLGIGFDFAFPQSNFGNHANYGTGPSIVYQNGITKSLNYTFSVAYLRFNGDGEFLNVKYRESFVPIKVGLRYFFSEYIYGGGEAGVSFSSANGSGSGTSFAYAPTLGVEFPVSNKGSIDLGVRYEGWSRSSGARSFIGLRAGYNF
ncbi:opacity protein-like surface antigen [Pedobacter sp. UYP24]